MAKNMTCLYSHTVSFLKPLCTVPSAQTMPSCSTVLVLWQCLSICPSFFFICGSPRQKILQDNKFFSSLINTWFGLQTGIKQPVCILKSLRILHISFSKMDLCLCIYHLVAWLKFNFLYNSKWITFPTQSCLVLYFLCVSSICLLCN